MATTSDKGILEKCAKVPRISVTDSFTQSLTHPVNNYPPSTYSVPCIILGTGDTAVSKIHALEESASWYGKMDSKQADIQHANGAEHYGEIQERQVNPKGGRGLYIYIGSGDFL